MPSDVELRLAGLKKAVEIERRCARELKERRKAAKEAEREASLAQKKYNDALAYTDGLRGGGPKK